MVAQAKVPAKHHQYAQHVEEFISHLQQHVKYKRTKVPPSRHSGSLTLGVDSDPKPHFFSAPVSASCICTSPFQR